MTTTHQVAWAHGRRAASGVPTGRGAAMAAVLVTVFGPTLSGWLTELLAQPAVWTVAGSLLTRGPGRDDAGGCTPRAFR